MGDRVRANVTASPSAVRRGTLEALVNPISVTDSDHADLSHAGAWFKDDAVIACPDSEQDRRPLHLLRVRPIRISRHLAQSAAHAPLRLRRERLELGVGLV